MLGFFKLSLLLFASSVSCAYACTTVSKLVKQQFTRFYMLERRGCPETFILPFYSEYVNALILFVSQRYPNTQDFGATCLTAEDVAAVEFGHAVSSVDHAIASLGLLNPEMFFLPESKYPDSSLLPLRFEEEKLVNDSWSISMSALEKPPHPKLSERIAVLPKTIEIFYDPNSADVQTRYEDLADDGNNSNDPWSAEYMVTRVLDIVIRLELLGVPRQDSLQILKHCIGFVFSCIRATRKEGQDLYVPTVYLPWYQEAFRNLSNGINVSQVPEFPDDLIHGILRNEIEMLSSFDSWGKLTHFNFHNSLVNEVHIGESIFHPKVLSQIMDGLEILSSSRMYKSDGLVSKTGKTEHLMATTTVRSGTQCDLQLYVYHPRPGPLSTSLELCCPTICDNIPLIMTVGVLSIDDCCTYCNQATCDFHATNPLVDLSAVHISPYGYSPEGSIPVMI